MFVVRVEVFIFLRGRRCAQKGRRQGRTGAVRVGDGTGAKTRLGRRQVASDGSLSLVAQLGDGSSWGWLAVPIVQSEIIEGMDIKVVCL